MFKQAVYAVRNNRLSRCPELAQTYGVVCKMQSYSFHTNLLSDLGFIGLKVTLFYVRLNTKLIKAKS